MRSPQSPPVNPEPRSNPRIQEIPITLLAHLHASRDLRASKKRPQSAREELATIRAQGDALREQLERNVAGRESRGGSFDSPAAAQLRTNRDEFLKQAGERLEKSKKQSQELQKRHEAIDEKFGEFENTQGEIEKERTEALSAMREQVFCLWNSGQSRSE